MNRPNYPIEQLKNYLKNEGINKLVFLMKRNFINEVFILASRDFNSKTYIIPNKIEERNITIEVLADGRMIENTITSGEYSFEEYINEKLKSPEQAIIFSEEIENKIKDILKLESKMLSQISKIRNIKTSPQGRSLLIETV